MREMGIFWDQQAPLLFRGFLTEWLQEGRFEATGNLQHCDISIYEISNDAVLATAIHHDHAFLSHLTMDRLADADQ